MDGSKKVLKFLTNRSMTFQTIDIHQVKGDRIIRTWHVEDWQSVLFQLGALPLKR